MTPDSARSGWCGTDPPYVSYHDTEWGVFERDEMRLFEAIVLDGGQAGSARLTILPKRDATCRVFAGFDPEKLARHNACRAAARQSGIMRNRLKIESAIGNARAVLRLRDRGRTGDRMLSGFVGGHTRRNRRGTLAKSSATSPKAMLGDLGANGFTFVGPAIDYALRQACGLIGDRIRECFRCTEV